MYYRQRTWLENGPCPAVKTIPVPAVFARRGVSGLGLSLEYCNSGWSLLNPVAWFGGCAANDLANVYEKIQYGTPPAVVTPPAPTVDLTSAAWLDETGKAVQGPPGSVYAGTDASGAPIYAIPQTAAESQAAIVKKQNAAIDAAIASGQWNPAGNLPLNALDLSNWWDKYGKLVMIGGAAVGGLLVVNAVRR